MSSSGVIYAAIALLWAAVLIPMWLRSQDSSSGERSAERFGQAMRVLSRRPDADEDTRVDEDHGDYSETMTTARQQPPQPKPEWIPQSRPVPQPQPQSRPSVSAHHHRPRRKVSANRSRTAARPSLAKRRARSLAVLAGLTALLFLLAVAGLLPLWAPLPVVLLMVAFVVHLRTQAVRAQASRRSRRAPDQQREAAGRHTSDEDAPEAERSSRRRSRFVAGPSRAMVVETKRMGAAKQADLAQQAGDLSAFDDNEAWRPNPLPLPTYVTAPKAMRPIRVIDLTTPGAWSSGRVFDDEALADEDVLAADVAADELDALLEHEAAPKHDSDASRRAVGD